MKANRWFYFLPGAVYANHADFSDPVTEMEARAAIRKSLGKYVTYDTVTAGYKHTAKEWIEPAKLPAGTQVWPGRI